MCVGSQVGSSMSRAEKPLLVEGLQAWGNQWCNCRHELNAAPLGPAKSSMPKPRHTVGDDVVGGWLKSL
jgi:hypothetical protein